MTDVNLLDASRQAWAEVAADVSGALVYLDAGAAEVVHTNLGLQFLLGLGVANANELEAAHPQDAAMAQLMLGRMPTTLAIFVTQLLTDAHQHIFRAVMAHSSVTHVRVYSSISEHAHACQTATELSVEAFSEYKAMLLHDLNRASHPRLSSAAGHSTTRISGPSNANGNHSSTGGMPAASYQQSLHLHTAGSSGGGSAGALAGGGSPSAGAGLSISVSAFPLHACALDPSFFVLPAASAAASLAHAGGVAAGWGPADAPRDTAAEEVSDGLALVAHALVGLAAQLGFKLEPFTLGPVSQALGAEVASLPVPIPDSLAARGGPMPMSLLLIDRGLDALSPSLHGNHPWDALLALAPRRCESSSISSKTGTSASSSASAGGGKANGGSPGRPRSSSSATSDGWLHAAGRPMGHSTQHQRVAWRPVDLRVELPGTACAVDLLQPLQQTSLAGTSGKADNSNGGMEDAGTESSSTKTHHNNTSTSTSTSNSTYQQQQQQQQQQQEQQQQQQQQQQQSSPALLHGSEVWGDVCDRVAVSRLESLIRRKPKDAPQLLRKWLKEAIRQEKLNPSIRSKAGAVPPAELAALAECLLSSGAGSALRHRGLATLALATARALSGPAAQAWEAAGSAEAALLQTLAASHEAQDTSDTAGLIEDLLHGILHRKGPLHVGHALSLLVACYSASPNLPAHVDSAATPVPQHASSSAGRGWVSGPPSQHTLPLVAMPLSREEEGRVKQLLLQVLQSAAPQELAACLPPQLQHHLCHSATPVLQSVLQPSLDSFFSRLHYLATARAPLRDFRTVTHSDLFAEAAGQPQCMVRQVLRKVLLQAGDVTDWNIAASAGGGGLVRGLLSAGLGRIGGLMAGAQGLVGSGSSSSSRTKPWDSQALCVFVVGGISAAEVREARQELDDYVGPAKPHTLLLGGTALLTPEDVVMQLMA